jgi:SAM-dependent methyltransferase
MNMNAEKYYESRFVFDKGRTKVWRAINEYLQKYIPSDASVLDIGCGYADFINGIKASKKYAIDLNPNMDEFILDKSTMFISQSVLVELHVEDSSLDVIFASNLFEHFNDQELDLLVKNIKVKLKPNGRLILIQPNIFYAYREYWDDYTHKKAFSHVSLNDFLISYNFDVVHTKKQFIPFSLKSRLPKSYFLTKMYLRSPIKPMAKQMLFVAQKK